MYNKLKNIVPFKLKFEDFSARLLELKDEEKTVLDFLILNSANAGANIENIIKNELNNTFFIGVFKNDSLLVLFNLIENQEQQDKISSNLFIVDGKFLNNLDGFLTKLKSDLLLTLRISNFEITLLEEQRKLAEIFMKNGFVEKEKKVGNIILNGTIEKKEATLESKCFKDGKLVFFPSKREEQVEIYAIMKKWFEIGKTYTEIEVNGIIKSKIGCKDCATLRRDMFDNGFLKRNSEGTKYWIE